MESKNNSIHLIDIMYSQYIGLSSYIFERYKKNIYIDKFAIYTNNSEEQKSTHILAGDAELIIRKGFVFEKSEQWGISILYIVLWLSLSFLIMYTGIIDREYNYMAVILPAIFLGLIYYFSYLIAKFKIFYSIKLKDGKIILNEWGNKQEVINLKTQTPEFTIVNTIVLRNLNLQDDTNGGAWLKLDNSIDGSITIFSFKDEIDAKALASILNAISIELKCKQ